MTSTNKTVKHESDNGGVTWKWLVGAILVSIVVGCVGIYFDPTPTNNQGFWENQTGAKLYECKWFDPETGIHHIYYTTKAGMCK